MLEDYRKYLAVLYTWLFVIIMLFFAVSELDARNELLRFGHNERLYFAGLKIDTWTKWGVLMSFLVLDSCVNKICTDLMAAWINVITIL